MVRCSVCGYVMKEGDLGDRCPACGAPRASFEPYVDPLAGPRRRALDRHLHPIAAHFPVALAATAFVFSLALLFLTGEGESLLLSTFKILVLLLPFLTLAAGLAGLADGKVRFGKLRNSAILKRKLWYAAVLLAVSSALAFSAWYRGFQTPGASAAAVLLSAAAVAAVWRLGRLGTGLVGAALHRR